MPITTFRDPALSLWQSALHRVLAVRASAASGGLHVSADHAAMMEVASAARGSVASGGAALYARLAVAKIAGDHAAVARIEDEIRFSVTDPLWAEVLLEFERSRLTGRVDAYMRHASMGDFVLDPLPDRATIALVADWATGAPSARAVLEQIASFGPDVVIHLGDVYFSGEPHEVREHFFDVFDAVFGDRMPRVLCLAGNHDRYSGGHGLVEMLSRLGQPATYFCLRNAYWQLLGMDTSYHDLDPTRRHANVTDLEASELEWHLDKLRNAGGRGNILLSHHPLFSWTGIGAAPDGRRLAVSPKLRAALAPALADVAYWFWGHEHNLGIYAPYAGLARGRGIGSGAIPVLVEQDPYATVEGLMSPDDEAGPPAPLPGTRLGHNGVVYNHAFAILELDGPRATARYHQSDTSGAVAGRAPAAEMFFSETVTSGQGG